MITYTLMVLFCMSATDCRWWREGIFLTEQYCDETGREIKADNPRVYRYKCVVKLLNEGEKDT